MADKGKKKKEKGSYSMVYRPNETVVTDKIVKRFSPNQNKMINELEIIRTLGKGAYGKVKLARHQKDGREYAIKIISKKFLAKKRVGMMGNALQDVFREIEILKSLHHPNIVPLYEVLDNGEHEKIYMVFELMKGGAVRAGVVEQEPLPLDLCWKYLRDAFMGLEYVHSQNIIHRDIKPENLLLSEDGFLKLADFGVSVIVDSSSDSLRKTAGSPAFLAPETSTGEEFEGRPVDVWALGVTLYVFVFGRCPFVAKSSLQIINVIKNEELTFPFEIEQDLKDFFMCLLDKDPKTRITMADIRTHNWVTRNGSAPLPDPDGFRLSMDSNHAKKRSTSYVSRFFSGKNKEKDKKDKDKGKAKAKSRATTPEPAPAVAQAPNVGSHASCDPTASGVFTVQSSHRASRGIGQKAGRRSLQV